MDYTPGAKKAAEVLEELAVTFEIVGRLFGKGRQYGAFCMLGHTDLQYMPRTVSMLYGDMPDATRCYYLATEKVARLSRNPEHVSSFQSRAPDEDKYGGAIRLPKARSPIIGFMAWSSFPELVDEAYMLAVAMEAGLMTFDDAVVIANVSNNEFFPKICHETAKKW